MENDVERFRTNVYAAVRRAAAFVLICAAVLGSGCAIQLKDAPAPGPPPEPSAQELNMTPRIEIEAALYFLNRTRSKLEAETRSVAVEQNASPELAIVRALLAGPSAEGLHPVASGFSAERVEVMPDLVNVYLRRSAGEDGPWNVAVLKLAIAASLNDYSGVRYVNMLIDGEEPGYAASGEVPAVPIGASGRPGDLRDEVSSLLQKSTSPSYDAYVALYFLDLSESWLLPEVTRVTITANGDTVRDIVQLLLNGPSNGYSLQRSLDPGLELLTHEIVETEQGRMLRLMFNRLPTVFTSSFVDGEQMAAAALAYTLTNFIPGIRGVQLTDRANPTRVMDCIPESYRELIGNRIVIYLPNTPGGVTMTGVERVVAQSESSDLEVVLDALMRGPRMSDSRDVWPAAPDGISVDSVIRTYRAGEMIVIDLKDTVSAILTQSGAHDERVFLFSIVNTMTNLKGVRCVQFLEEGKRVSYLGDGTICVLDPMMKNPGIIR